MPYQAGEKYRILEENQQSGERMDFDRDL